MIEIGEQWHFHLVKGISRWIALAKKEPFVTGDPIMEPGDVWFEFWETPETAMLALKRSIAN